MSATDNRREGFRLNDNMKLHVKLADEEHLEEILPDFDAFRMRYCLKSHLRNQTEVWLPKLLKIRSRDPEVAEYLEHLETQIAQLASRLSNDHDIESDDADTETLVNLSASGLQFHSDEEFDVGQKLELGMLLSTIGIQLVAIAEVIRVERYDQPKSKKGTKDFLVSTQYSQIHPDDTEAIIRHMAKLQQIQLQKARNT
ncbi:PilZ domain-containing protein [Granulosicoccus antarcticus]|uniref:PilZ domain-containing protein n=1 Tax=Granulosicoccus antarcticus IMCC3135 TaxID=1192854 RepID=A0A2Z2NK69_9GAMM|nr:PilZ domain-containing protein [Granulosicoccus antarcticus]ASJ71792.1 hypothetical protein IMCC3135_08465 [Granulosicoccus antarcticus IMCC3135]